MLRRTLLSPLFAALVLLAAAAPARAVPPQVVSIRGGIALEGPQHTLRNGWTAGWMLEFPRRTWAPGLELAYARHDGSGFAAGAYDRTVEVVQIGPTLRRDIGSRRAHGFLGASAGLTLVSWGDRSWLGHDNRRTCFGGWFGGGWVAPVSPRMEIRLDARYHPMALQDPDLGGSGDLGDFFTVGISLATSR